MWDKVIGAAVGAALGAGFGLAVFVFRACGKLFEMLAEKVGRPTLAQALDRATPKLSRLPVRATAPVAGSNPVADQIYTVQFPGGWKVHVLVYLKDRRVTRVLKPGTAALEDQMRFRLACTSQELPPVALEGMTVEDALKDTEVTARQAINDLQDKMKGVLRYALGAPEVPGGRAAAVGQRKPADVPVSAASSNERRQQDRPSPGPAVPAANQMTPSMRTEPPKATPFTSATLLRKGKAYQGQVLAAGLQPSNFGGSTYTVSLQMPDEVRDFRGIELRNNFQRLGVQVGDIVAITPLGKKPVQGSDGTRTHNLFDVQIIERGQASRLAAA